MSGPPLFRVPPREKSRELTLLLRKSVEVSSAETLLEWHRFVTEPLCVC